MRTIVDKGLTPNYGARQGFATTPAPGGVSVSGVVQLLSVRPVIASAWTITLEPVTTKGNQGVTPWFTGYDGTLTVPGPTNTNQPINSPNGYKVLLTWGAGGIRQTAVFDYPMAGASFTLFADTVDLSVTGIDASQVFADDSVLPVFGAFMVPGAGLAAAGMRLSDVPMAFNATAGQTVRWSVKPHSRYLWVAQYNAANRAIPYTIAFENFQSSATLWATTTAVDAGFQVTQASPIVVPPQATFVEITPSAEAVAPGMAFALTWEMYFS